MATATILEQLILPFFKVLGLDTYLLDPEVTELMVTNGMVWVERSGRLIEIEGLQVNEHKLAACIETLAQTMGDHVDDYAKPWLDTRLPDGSRVAAVFPPMSPEGILLTIRKFFRHFTTDELIERGALTEECRDLIRSHVHDRKNILFSGGTSTGKTTMANAFVRHIPLDERILVIEKPIEMKLDHKCAGRLEAYPATGDRPASAISQLLSMTLRHRPDRIIVGEVKDPEAAYGLLHAMNTGHDGTMSTIHSNTALSALNRLSSLAMPGFGSLDLARQETAAAIDLVVEVKRATDGWRGVNRVLAVSDYDDRSRRFQTTEQYAREA